MTSTDDSTPAPADETMARIGAAVTRAQRGEPDAARRELTSLWNELGPGGDPLHRCTLAHHLADLQEDPREELAWDQRALAAADAVTDERAAAAGATGPVAAFYPSLHLNLGEDHRKLGDLPAARRHLELGRAAAGELSDDGYGAMVRGGLEALATRLGDG
ncbi:hypothetical protein [Geodermatophilus sp. CPCC 206100]|uniref:hypothetical protein n=1 Tax=Geodermatophilus sp. CPCC 206100 TaxID=3020054 RepID=UPI003B00E767